ncbi:MAG: DNA-J related domain-containing protein, partial [Oleibacter sp.]|nr:DNA-J related domain-containing protein [Thalassolituus sp.]
VGLFRTHFLLMHCLYLLQQRWADEQQGYLSISALKIQRLAWQDNQENTLDRHDPLAAYYLDLTHLDNTGSEDVQALLDDFWQRMLLPINKNEDLAALGLENDAAPDEIRSQYRRLAMQNHPDRGGDAVIFGKITSAYQRLRQTW